MEFEEAIRRLRRAVWSNGADGRAWIAGEDPDGHVHVQVESAEMNFSLRLPDMESVDLLVGPPMEPMRGPVEVPYVTRTWTPPAVAVRDVGSPLFRSGPLAQDPEAIDLMRNGGLEAAIYTCRGPTEAGQGIDYKPFNEDGVFVQGGQLADGREWMAVGAFDQAGGEGRVANAHGAASDAAARAMSAVLLGFDDEAKLADLLYEGVRAADKGVRQLGVRAVCTLAVAVVIPSGTAARAFVATVGDSRVLHLGPNGELRARTRLHNVGAKAAAGEQSGIPPLIAHRFAAVLSRGLGGEDSSHDLETWELAPGDRLVVGTDGLGDARELEDMPTGTWHADVCSEDIARIVGATADCPAAVAALVGYSLDQAADRHGKPDNIGVGVLRVR